MFCPGCLSLPQSSWDWLCSIAPLEASHFQFHLLTSRSESINPVLLWSFWHLTITQLDQTPNPLPLSAASLPLPVQPMFCVLIIQSCVFACYDIWCTVKVLEKKHVISMCEAMVVQVGKALGCWLFGLSSSSKSSDLTCSVHVESLWRVTASWWTSFVR